jgi:hypothetical protein
MYVLSGLPETELQWSEKTEAIRDMHFLARLKLNLDNFAPKQGITKPVMNTNMRNEQ